LAFLFISIHKYLRIQPAVRGHIFKNIVDKAAK